MECLTKCLSSLEGEHEFGNLATYSPLSISQIRERQEYSPHTLEYPIGNDSKGVIMLKYGYLCQRGLYPDDMDKENQDSFKIIPSFDGEDRTIMMGVFDGHGEYGDDCSGFVRDNIEEYLAEARHEDKKNLENAFRVAFRKINAAMHMEQVRFTASHSFLARAPCRVRAHARAASSSQRSERAVSLCAVRPCVHVLLVALACASW